MLIYHSPLTDVLYACYIKDDLKVENAKLFISDMQSLKVTNFLQILSFRKEGLIIPDIGTKLTAVCYIFKQTNKINSVSVEYFIS